MIEAVGLILGVLGIVFAFETPRKRFVSLIGLQKTASNVFVSLPSSTNVDTCGSNLESEQFKNIDTLSVAPIDIVDKKEHLSELEFDEYFKSFVGHTVMWDGRIGTVSLNKDGTAVMIQITFCEQKLRGFLNIKIKDYPNVKLFKSGDTAIVKGKIHSPNWPTFDLEDAIIIKWTKKGI